METDRTAGAGAVRFATSDDADAELAVQEVFRALDPPTLAGMLLFCSYRYASDAVAAAIAARASDLPIVGCTTSGEIGEGGFRDGSITAIGFPADAFALDVSLFDALDRFEPGAAQGRIHAAVATAAARSTHLGPAPSRAAIFLVDGLSHREELLTATLQDALGEIPLIGGSSGDGLAFRETLVFHDGVFRRNAAAVAILSSRRPMRPFRSQHYSPGDKRMVITRADPIERIVHEINAEPAADEYARLIGATRAELGPELFAANPPMVRAGGEYYCRSIQTANADGSLTFYGAIDEGIVLTLGQPHDVLGRLDGLFRGIEAELGALDAVIGFDCVLNSLDLERRQLRHQVSSLFARKRVVGFNTYGEQYHALHTNQSFSGLAIGC